MEDRLIGRLGLAIGPRVSHSPEPHLIAQIGQIVCELAGIKLLVVMKDDGLWDAETGDDVSPNEPSYFSCSYRGYGLGFYSFGEVVDCHKKILTLPRSFGERTEDIHSLCGEWQGG